MERLVDRVPAVSHCPGGYLKVLPLEIDSVWAAYRAGLIAYFDLRLWWGLKEVQARRLASGSDSYEGAIPELQRLVGATRARRVRVGLKRLAAAGVAILRASGVVFGGRVGEARPFGQDPRRPIPVPRRLVRWAAMEVRGRARMAMVMGAVLRCCYRAVGGGVRFVGRISAGWVAKVFGVLRERARQARAWLVALGCAQKRGGGLDVEYELTTGERPKKRGALYFNLLTEGGEKRTTSNPNSVAPKSRPTGEPPRRSRFRRIKPSDLREPRRIRRRYADAVHDGLIEESEGDRFAFVASIAHAVAQGEQPEALFAFNLRNRNRWWSQEEEDEARKLLRLVWPERYGGITGTSPGSSQGFAGSSVACADLLPDPEHQGPSQRPVEVISDPGLAAAARQMVAPEPITHQQGGGQPTGIGGLMSNLIRQTAAKLGVTEPKRREMSEAEKAAARAELVRLAEAHETAPKPKATEEEWTAALARYRKKAPARVAPTTEAQDKLAKGG